jgi:rhodanese-related sulfurtransferase
MGQENGAADLSEPRAVYERRDDVQIVDVREGYEWEAGRIDQAVHVPLNELMAGRGPDLDPGRPVVAVCRSGNRSELATLMLQARGFEAYNMVGGMEAWVRQGLPFSTPAGRPGRVA